jgi:dTDP-4-dehydrorhamnose reductase
MVAAARGGQKVVGTCLSHPLPGLRRVDLRRPDEVRSLLEEVRPSVVFLSAAHTNVDYCQTHAAETYASNVLGVCHAVAAANAVGAKVVYFSSDYVFDGSNGPYCEEDPPNPICQYGWQKVLAEHHVALHATDYLIVRTTVVYGWEPQGKNFIYRLLDHLRRGETIRVPVDQVGSPTYAPNLAAAVLELAESDARGVYHVAGPERANRYEFACAAAKIFGADAKWIEAVATPALGQAAPRPLNGGMMMDKLAARIHAKMMGYHEGLKAMASEKRTP